jgi:hypothetical protein
MMKDVSQILPWQRHAIVCCWRIISINHEYFCRDTLREQNGKPVFFSVLLANVFVGAGNGSYPAPAKRETARERAWQQERRPAGHLCCARPFAGS